MPAEHPETQIIPREEAARIKACAVVHAWLPREDMAALEFHAGRRGEHVDRLVAILLHRIVRHPGAVEAILPTDGRPR